MYSKLGTVSILTTQSSSNAESEVNKYIFVQAGYLKDLIVHSCPSREEHEPGRTELSLRASADRDKQRDIAAGQLNDEKLVASGSQHSSAGLQMAVRIRLLEEKAEKCEAFASEAKAGSSFQTCRKKTVDRSSRDIPQADGGVIRSADQVTLHERTPGKSIALSLVTNQPQVRGAVDTKYSFSTQV
ncbi:MAG: hypothetical protein FRX49_02769 [Trebouxia sp. A1-2]|nr:MAG: hypothetical protein FRX49_02769 [Trebouxia sp. A1-2]